MANQKLLLVQDVDDLGRSGDVVTVRPGFARNFLLPQRLAVFADANTLKMQARLQEERTQRAIHDKKESEALAEKFVGLSVTTSVKVDHEGHMYGSVTAADIVDLIQEQAGFTLEKKNIQLKHALKEVGEFEVPIKLKEGVTSSVSVKIVPEEVNG